MRKSDLQFTAMREAGVKIEPAPRTQTLSDEEIGRLWRKHFPKRDHDFDSRQICYGVCSIIEFEAALREGDSHAERLNVAFEATGIPREEFSLVRVDTLKGFDRLV